MAECLQDELSIKPTVILLLEENEEPHTNKHVISFSLFVFPFGHPSPLCIYFLGEESSLLFSNSVWSSKYIKCVQVRLCNLARKNNMHWLLVLENQLLLQFFQCNANILDGRRMQTKPVHIVMSNHTNIVKFRP